MYKIFFNSTLMMTCDKEHDAIAFSLNVHNLSNIPHNIVVTKEDETIIYFIQK